MIDLPTDYRARIRPLLPERAFLRRDRGDALFITNAPMLSDADVLVRQLQTRGFTGIPAGGLLRIRPGQALVAQLELDCAPPDYFCQTLSRFRGRTPSDRSLELFARGVQLLECADPDRVREYIRQTRQLAALCLRKPQGGAYACALIAHSLETERSNRT